MLNLPILSSIIFLPLLGSLIIVFIKDSYKNYENNVKWAAFLTSFGTFILSAILWLNFNPTLDGYQFVEKKQWIDSFNFYYHIGF